MTTAATPAPVAPTLDDALGKIDALLTPGVVSMTQAQLQEHATAELEKAIAEATSGKAEASKARLEHLKAQVAAAKAIYDTGATLAAIATFKDPWQTLPGESAVKGIADPSVMPSSGDSNIQTKDDVLFVGTEKGRVPSALLKGLIAVAKASDASPLRKRLAKTTDGAQIIAKAGEAGTILTNIAMMFGITVEEPSDVLDYEFKWDVSDTISALQSAAKLEGVMAQMSGMMAAVKAEPPVPPAAPPPPAPAPAAKSFEQGTEGPWPLDMASVVFDEKTNIHKAAGEETVPVPYWGLDSGSAPKT